MVQNSKYQDGFSAVEALLVLIILGVVGFTGYFVWHAKQNTDKSLASNNSSAPTIKKKATTNPVTTVADPTADWLAAASPDGHFSLKYPSSWVQPSCKDDLKRMIALGPDASSVLKCASEFFGQIVVQSAATSDTSLAYDFSSGYTQLVKKTVTINGVSGQRTSAVASVQSGEGSLVDGTIVVEYTLTANGNTYVAHYQQYPSGAASTDVLADFDLMITKTLKFN